jgi:hypothetical protein
METNYETGSDPATGLTEYMSQDHDLRDHTGRDLDEQQKEQFEQQAARNGFSRQIVLSPDGDHLSADELDRATRETLNEWTRDHDTTEYVYSVHEDTDNPHAHIAATATRDSQDLWMDDDDLRELQDEIAADRFRDHTTERQRRLMTEQGREQELAREDRERELAAQLQDRDSEPEPERDQEDRGIDRDDVGLGMAAAGEAASAIDLFKTPWKIAQESRRKQREEQRRKQDRERDHGGRSR